MYLQLGFVLALSVAMVQAFGNGAPADVCVKERFNQPNHGEYRSQPLETIPYQVIASAASYQPGDSITRRKIFLNCEKIHNQLLTVIIFQ
jgi:hypothetical protein